MQGIILSAQDSSQSFGRGIAQNMPNAMYNPLSDFIAIAPVA